MKQHRLSTRGLLMLLLCVFLGSVFALSALAVYLDNNGFGPEDDAVSGELILHGPYFYNNDFLNEFRVPAETEQGIADLRALEKSVKNMTLKEYTSLIIWEAEFTYTKADGTTEQRTYRKSDASKDVDKFLCKYYKP